MESAKFLERHFLMDKYNINNLRGYNPQLFNHHCIKTFHVGPGVCTYIFVYLLLNNPPD